MFSGKRSVFLFLVVMAFRIIHCRGFGPIFSGTLLSTTTQKKERGRNFKLETGAGAGGGGGDCGEKMLKDDLLEKMMVVMVVMMMVPLCL